MVPKKGEANGKKEVFDLRFGYGYGYGFGFGRFGGDSV